MGCTGSVRKYEIDEDVFGFDTISFEFFSKLGLSQTDLDLLFTSFYDMDSDNSGTIRIDEFLIYFSVEGSIINNKIFSVFETNQCLSFMTYATTLWYFLSLDTNRIGAFVYRMFDQKNDDVMSIPQIVNMMKEVNADDSGNASKIEASVKSLPGYGERRTEINLSKFMTWAATVQSIFMPVTKTQFIIRAGLIGRQFWADQEEKREKNTQLNEPLIDISLRQQMDDMKFVHNTKLRKKELASTGGRSVNVAKTPGRNRFTQIMVQKLNKGNAPKREGKGDVSTKGASSIATNSEAKKSEAPAENRRRRSILKPNLVQKPSSSKIVPKGKGPPKTSDNKR
jgi:hypothetical protein